MADKRIPKRELSYGARDRLEWLYAQQIPEPPAAPEYSESEDYASQVVRINSGQRIFVEPATKNGYSNGYATECLGRLTLVSGVEKNVVLDMSVDALEQLIGQLVPLAASLRLINQQRVAHRQLVNTTNEAKKAWREQRQKTINAMWKQGKITTLMLEQLENEEDPVIDFKAAGAV